MMVIKEKSFSKASAKLGISQPAVTQQIKYIEDYLDTKIVKRKKNGILLTKEGEDLYRIVQKLEKCIQNSERELLKIVNKEFTFIIGASYAIGNYILPNYLNEIKKRIENEVYMHAGFSQEMIDELEEQKIDLALIESPIFKDDLIHREWLDDELVFFSNQPLPRYLKPEDLYEFNWICRDDASHTKKLVSEIFDDLGVSCSDFNILGILSSPTSIKEAIMNADKNDKPLVSMMSRHVIKNEVKNGTLFEARLKGHKIERKLYIAYNKERKNDVFINNVVNYLLSLNKVPL
jgi:DNA-binding transcriptional LysR family regulator